MGDPFTIGYWRSEGTTPARRRGAEPGSEAGFIPATAVVVDLADKTDQGEIFGRLAAAANVGPQGQSCENCFCGRFGS